MTNFLNRFILSLLLKGMLRMNLANSFRVKDSEKSSRFQKVCENQNTFWNWQSQQNTFSKPLGHSVCLVICPCLDRVLFFVCHCPELLEMLQPTVTPLHKQVNDILGWSSPFYKESSPKAEGSISSGSTGCISARSFWFLKSVAGVKIQIRE